MRNVIMRGFVIFSVVSCIALSSHSQSFRVDTVFVSIEDGPYISFPQVVSLIDDFDDVSNTINMRILQEYGIEDLENEVPNSFPFGTSAEFYYEIFDSIMNITIHGETWGYAYPSFNSVELFFCLLSGEILQDYALPDISSLFRDESAFRFFLDSLWGISLCEQQRAEATECAELEPYCSCDNPEYYLDSLTIHLHLRNDCYPRVAHVCTPYYNQSVTHEQILPLLNELGIYILTSNYYALHPVQQYYLRQEWYFYLQNE